jgi:Transmembrane amino acid transporter protein
MQSTASSYSPLARHEHHDNASDCGSNDVESTDGNNSTSGGSIAASPYWSVPYEKLATAKTGFSPLVAFCFTINYILGTGFLTIPWAFVQSGLVLSSILMVLSAVASDMAKDYMLETMARAEVMLDDQMHWIVRKGKNRGVDGPLANKERVLVVPPKRLQREREQLLALKSQQSDYDAINDTEENSGGRETNFQRSSSLPVFEIDLEGRSIEGNASEYQKGKAAAPGIVHLPQQTITLRQKAPPKYVVEERKFEVNALCRVFLGKRGLRAYMIVICLYTCGALWAYTSVFSSAMAAALPLFGDGEQSLNYLCYAIVFGCIVVPLSCLELDEQVPLQVLLTGCRFVMFFFMIGTSHLCAEDMGIARSADNGTVIADSSSNYSADYFRPAGIAKTLPILIFANIFHHSIPGLAHPVADKKNVGKIFSSTNAFTVAAYLILGLTLGTAFGKSIGTCVIDRWIWPFLFCNSPQVFVFVACVFWITLLPAIVV